MNFIDACKWKNLMLKWDSLIQACKRGNMNEVKEMLKDPSIQNNRAIVAASAYGHADIVEVLLEDGRFDPSTEKNWAIGIASENGHADVVALLLQDSRVDPSGLDNWAIQYASCNGHVDVVKMLLRDGRVDPTAVNEWAIKNAKTDEIREMLIAYKYRVDGQEYQKMKNLCSN